MNRIGHPTRPLCTCTGDIGVIAFSWTGQCIAFCWFTKACYKRPYLYYGRCRVCCKLLYLNDVKNKTVGNGIGDLGDWSCWSLSDWSMLVLHLCTHGSRHRSVLSVTGIGTLGISLDWRMLPLSCPVHVHACPGHPWWLITDRKIMWSFWYHILPSLWMYIRTRHLATSFASVTPACQLLRVGRLACGSCHISYRRR